MTGTFVVFQLHWRFGKLPLAHAHISSTGGITVGWWEVPEQKDEGKGFSNKEVEDGHGTAGGGGPCPSPPLFGQFSGRGLRIERCCSQGTPSLEDR